MRRTVRGAPASRWLDGLVGVLAIAAVGIAVVVAPIVADAGGTTAELVVNVSHPIGDVLLVALVTAFLCLGGGGRGLAWMLLGLGFALFAAADSAYLLLIANGITQSRPLRDARRRRRACAARGRPPRDPARCRWWPRGLRRR